MNNDYMSADSMATVPYPGSPIGRGSKGANVALMQRHLNDITPPYDAINSLIVDGIFGSAMYRATVRFQKQFSLTPDGVIGRKTWDKITSVHLSVTESTPTSVTTKYPGYVLTVGSLGDNVRFVQSYLNKVRAENGFTWLELLIDGAYGRKTESAVIAFQTIYRLKSDGKVGMMTWNVLIPEFNKVL